MSGVWAWHDSITTATTLSKSILYTALVFLWRFFLLVIYHNSKLNNILVFHSSITVSCFSLFIFWPIIMAKWKFLMPNFKLLSRKPDLFECNRHPVGHSAPLTCQSHDFMKSPSGAGGTIMKLRPESARALLRNGGRLWSGYTELSLSAVTRQLHTASCRLS